LFLTCGEKEKEKKRGGREDHCGKKGKGGKEQTGRFVLTIIFKFSKREKGEAKKERVKGGRLRFLLILQKGKKEGCKEGGAAGEAKLSPISFPRKGEKEERRIRKMDPSERVP